MVFKLFYNMQISQANFYLYISLCFSNIKENQWEFLSGWKYITLF
jgi:hypothetical protein